MSGLSKDLLVFDASQAADSDNVGAFLRASDGTLITHTTVGGKEALDVNMVNSISVDISAADGDSVIISDGTDNLAINADGSLNATVIATDLDIRDLAFATDKVDASGSVVALDAGTLAALENITVSATDLDIRNLVFATDKVDVSGSVVALDASTLAALENITVSASDLDIRNLVFASDKVDVSGSAVTAVVSATDLDIRDLSHVSDSVKIGDGTDFLAVNADGSINTLAIISGNVADDAVDSGNPIKVGSRAVSGPLSAVSAANDRADLISDLYRRLYTNDSANIGIASAAVAVADSAVSLSGSPLAGRRELLVQNLSNQAIFVGPSGVTTASGTRVAAGASGSFKVGQNNSLFAISANATAKDVRVLELA